MKRRLPDLREIRPLALIVLVAGLGVNLAALFLVNLPQSVRLGRSETVVRELMAELEARRGQVVELRNDVEWIQEQDAKLQVFFDQVLSGKAERMVSIQIEIREIAERHGVDPTSIGYSHEAEDEAADMVRFTVSFPLEGNYQSLRSFIRDIEQSRNFLVIDAIDLTSSREGGVVLALAIQLSTIFSDPDYGAFREGN